MIRVVIPPIVVFSVIAAASALAIYTPFVHVGAVLNQLLALQLSPHLYFVMALGAGLLLSGIIALILALTTTEVATQKEAVVVDVVAVPRADKVQQELKNKAEEATLESDLAAVAEKIAAEQQASRVVGSTPADSDAGGSGEGSDSGSDDDAEKRRGADSPTLQMFGNSGEPPGFDGSEPVSESEDGAASAHAGDGNEFAETDAYGHRIIAVEVERPTGGGCDWGDLVEPEDSGNLNDSGRSTPVRSHSGSGSGVDDVFAVPSDAEFDEAYDPEGMRYDDFSRKNKAEVLTL